MATPHVIHNEASHRFEIRGESGIALAAYLRHEDRLVLTHTEVPEAHEGQGWGAALAEAAFGYARQQGLLVEPECAFMATYARRHPALREVVAPAYRQEGE